MKTRLCLLVLVLANAVGNVALSRGMRQVGGIAFDSASQAAAFGLRALGNPYVLAGIGLLIVFFAAHMVALSRADLSYVLPMSATGYLLVTLLSWWWLGEAVPAGRWAGSALITAGVILVGSTGEATVPAPGPGGGDQCASCW